MSLSFRFLLPDFSTTHFLHNFVKDNLEIVVVFPLVYWIFFSIMAVHLFWASPCNAFWTELYGVMAKPCRNQATPMELFTMSSYLFVKEWYWLKLVTDETVRLRNKTSFLFYFFFSFLFNLIFFNEWSRSRLNRINRFRKPCRNRVDCHFISKREHDFLVLVFTGADQKFQT